MGFEKNDEYVEVPERIVEFRTKYPEGSLQPVNPAEPYKVENIDGQTVITYAAAAYRTPHDPRPGIGVAQEPFPGRTPYTKGSEIQNAETSAWGRAMVAAMAVDTKRGIASAVEVRNRKAEQEAEAAALNELRGKVVEAFKASGMNPEELIALFVECGGAGKPTASNDTEALSKLLQEMTTRTAEVPA
ncbi:hypothetical protein NONI108955_11170 [Nocardia ninae]|uniref:Uncharacterized protein n=1 Tax=Nocardia ninae NBRC 108245 TaxID=1210091 RepID=A0A511MP28_9NOCA|nr:hypothetical protein [Nocardia ninae]GEM41938.1 hypothetical protein NN4_64570 [Nocardia ninae NBRC 108245]